jgi:CBS domain-containing protein
MKISDVMTSPAITVHPAATVEEIARLMIAHRISAVPVVGDRNLLLGIVTEHDLFLKEKSIPFAMQRMPALFDQWAAPEQLPELYEATRHYTAADVMTKKVTSVQEESSLGAVAQLMLNRNLKRVPVLRDGQLVGIITRSDLVGLLVRERL